MLLGYAMLSDIRLGLLGLFFIYFFLKMLDKDLSGQRNVMEPNLMTTLSMKLQHHGKAMFLCYLYCSMGDCDARISR